MVRMFDTHKVRKHYEPEGLWEFTEAPLDSGLPEGYPRRLPVPGCWEQHPALLTYRGVGFYRRTIRIERPCNLRIECKGVSHTGEVFFDGSSIARHYNAYTAFEAVIPDVAEGTHELVIKVDNTFSEASALHMPNDYYTYGGLIRPVVLEEIGGAYIERLESVTQMSGGDWTLTVKAFLKSLSEDKKEYKLKLSLDGAELSGVSVSVRGEGEAVFSSTLQNIEPWSAEHPRLYTLSAVLCDEDGSPIDDLIERIGFRQIEVKGTQLLLNGEAIRLTGFNRHEDHGIVGCAIPPQLMINDLDLIRATGANTVRTCHYPNDERFLDLCDELGFFVWEENHARGLSLERMQNPNFERQCDNCNREMVQQHFNHPSIIIWGIMNECASNAPEGRAMYQKQFEQLRAMDKSRPLTFASCHREKDICFDLADIVSLNLYTNWYVEDDIEAVYLRLLEYINASAGTEKPVIMSEFGAGGIYGYRDPGRVKWSEERQCDLLDEALGFYLSRDEIVGALIWQFSDCRVTEEDNWFAVRPHTRNNKGVVDIYRRPKMAYETVKKHFRLTARSST